MESHPRGTRILKLEPSCCKECVRKVKRAMLKVEGVHSITVNANQGTIEVNSEIDPQVLIAIAAKAGKRAQLLWEPEPPQTAPLPPPPTTTTTPPPLTTTPPTTAPSPPPARPAQSTCQPPPPNTRRRHPPPPDTTTTRRPTTPPPITPPARPAQSTCQPEVHIRNFDGSNQKIHLQDLVDINARDIKHMKIINKKIIKILLKESHDNPSSDHSGDSPSPIAPPPSASKNSNGDGEASSSGGNVEAATAVEPETKDVPCNSKPINPAVANVNCSNRGSSCRLM